MVLSQVILKPGREKSVLNRHPWIFSGAIARVEGNLRAGDVVDIWNSKARFLARGVVNPHSQIVVRILTWDQDEAINAGFWHRRLERTLQTRARLVDDPMLNAFRIVHSEADGIPGLIVDKYGPWLVAQFLSAAADRFRNELVTALVDLIAPQGIYERSDDTVREKEGLIPIAGPIWGETPPDLIEIVEHGYAFLVDVKLGQKTGFYLDQRENRLIASRYVRDKEVLNVFCYTGGFAVYAAGAGARAITNVDSSESAIALAERNVLRNGFTGREDSYAVADAFSLLRSYRDYGWQFDVVILDPPKFAHYKRHVQPAMRGYKDINMLALKLLRPGGVLVTFSCSGAVPVELFQKALFAAAIDAGRDVQIIEHLGQGVDHPVLVTFPESAYLKGFVCSVW